MSDKEGREQCTVGLIQMNSTDKVNDNLEHIRQQVAILATKGCQLIITPENSLLFSGQQGYLDLAEKLGAGPMQMQLAAIALQYDVWLVIGSFPTLGKEGKLYSSCLVFNNSGELVGHYHKMHLFDVEVDDGHQSYRESDVFASGKEVALVDTPIGHLGLSICYDLRFAHLFDLLRHRGAEVIVVPAAFTAVTGEAHWETLLKARAIENQAWVVGVGQCGSHSANRQTWGHSMVIDPWGNVIAKADDQPCNLVADIDLNKVTQVRARMPVASHQRITSFITTDGDNE